MGLSQGAESRPKVNVKYVNLHSGRLAETYSKKYVVAKGLEAKVKDWREYTKYNQENVAFDYYAYDYPSLTGYVTGIRWFSKAMGDTEKVGWHIYLDCGDYGIFAIELTPRDRFAFRSFMAMAVNVDFTKLVKISAFTNNKDWQIFVMWQENEDGEVVTIKPSHKELWVTSELAANIKKKDYVFSDDEKKRLHFKEDGTLDLNYPYVRQRKNPSTQKLEWSFDKWQEFLNEQFEEHVLPAVADAQKTREASLGDVSFDTETLERESVAFTENEELPVTDDDIPF